MAGFVFHPMVLADLAELGLSVDMAPSAEQWRAYLELVDKRYRQKASGTVILDQKFDNMITHAVDAFFLHDTLGNILEVNRAACEMLGYSREELLSMQVSAFEMELKPGAIWDSMRVDQVFTVAGTHRRKDGSMYPVETRVGAFMAEDTKIVLAMCRDVTGRKETERELLRLNKQLEGARDEAVEASKSKSTFLANMSHELRTPLNAVIGYSEFLLEEMEDDGDSRYTSDLQNIRTAGDHLLSLINDILDLSKIEAGQVDVEIREFGVEKMIAGVRSTVQPLADKHNNSLVVEVADGIGAMRSDATKIRQVLLNLLSNACKFTSEGTVRLSVEVVPGSEQIRMTIADSGLGMNEDELGRVFLAFQQADSSTARRFGGTGLGLTISEQFCRLLGGSITVESTPGEGTTFVVELPRDWQSPVQ